MGIKKGILLVMMTGGLVACSDSSNKQGSADAICAAMKAANPAFNCSFSNDANEQIQLKGVALLASTIQATFGANKTIEVTNANVNLLEKYRKNFGDQEGLSVGKTYSDVSDESNKMTGYFMALNHIATNVAVQCFYSGDSLCNCDSPGAARELMLRAMPYLDFDSAEGSEVVSDLAGMCLNNPSEAITQLIASVAFAKRN